MEDSSIKASFMAIMPTSGRRNQHGWLRRVCEESIMSSETRKKAWRSSVSQPRVADKRYSSGESARPRRIELVSTTEMPRLHFPPMVLYLSDFYVFSALSVPEKGEGEGG